MYLHILTISGTTSATQSFQLTVIITSTKSTSYNKDWYITNFKTKTIWCTGYFNNNYGYGGDEIWFIFKSYVNGSNNIEITATPTLNQRGSSTTYTFTSWSVYDSVSDIS